MPDSLNYQITAQFQQVLDLLSVGTPAVVFVTGSAGTGKSTLIEVLRAELDRRLVVLAPTGVAALNVRGQTIHSFFQLPPGPQPKAKKVLGPARDVIAQMDILVIDEVSMVRADLLDAIDEALRLNSKKKSARFGGKTVVLVGDMHQLPPVIAGSEERQLFEDVYESPYFFSADCLKHEPLTCVTLTESFRQSDEKFIQLLDNIRLGRNLEHTVEALNASIGDRMSDAESRLVLTAVNARARQFNEQQLGRLTGSEWLYSAELNGDWLENETQLPSPTQLRLKVDAQVMFTKNGPDWVNGTLGRVVDLDHESIEVELLSDTGSGAVVGVERESWERYRYNWDAKRRHVDMEVIGTYTQFPFILAWAVTVHKAQGLTLDNIDIDLGRGFFATGQAYVALSRCRTVEGIGFNRPMRAEDIRCDPVIQSFYAGLYQPEC